MVTSFVLALSAGLIQLPSLVGLGLFLGITILVVFLVTESLHRLVVRSHFNVLWTLIMVLAMIAGEIALTAAVATALAGWSQSYDRTPLILQWWGEEIGSRLGQFFVPVSMTLVSFSFVYLLWLGWWGRHRRHLQRPTRLSNGVLAFVYAAVTTPVVAFVIFGLLAGWIAVSASCNITAQETFHRFNAHLKSVCRDRADKSECPREEKDLAAFNQQEYRNLQLCSETKYAFDSTTGVYTWSVRYREDLLLVANPDLPGGFKVY